MKTLCCDIGSGSIRVAIIEYSPENVLKTKPLSIAIRPLKIYNRKTDFYEQKTSEIWTAFQQCTSECLEKSGLSFVSNISAFTIDAIAFSATCSLVIVDGTNVKNDECDVIMWMDHRAKHEASIINQSKNEVLTQFGGVCSPEFSLSKLYWLYRNDKSRFDSANAFMELSDWITYRCSQYYGSPEKFPRSLCCVTCKWGYDANHHKWREDLFNQLGITWNQSLEDRIGRSVINPGIRVSSLSVETAKDIGFIIKDDTKSDIIESVSIASSLIDAHAGAVSMLVFGNQLDGAIDTDRLKIDQFENVFCMISGTSTCHMILNQVRTPTKGVWGPYLDAIIPGYYLREAGQSATGKLVEQVINSHFNGKLPKPISTIISDLNEQLKLNDFNHRNSLIVNPTFHGNRSPIANPLLKGAIYGLTLEATTLLDLYVATVEAIAYETRFIVEEIEKNSQPIKKIIVTGGLTKNDLYLQLHADILNTELVTFSAGEADLMLVGASVIAFTGSLINDDKDRNKLTQLLQNLRADSNGFAEHVRTFQPRTNHKEYHQNKYQCYRRLLDCCLEMETTLSNVSNEI
ncbi:hypothetical protein RDWZM_000084 [Blomia tropicalis]|uniref:glycerol kinase n=1 Tax=Blomia tropicalis TaxID=40697 RepID=A0A9Q0M9X1_BLOTA|nr:hypothetical protein BLOT_015745 [Blomia tropicalis]KAJ6221539.1 hypothetical protein RDWZM_000084 [Blomia tropicalis]